MSEKKRELIFANEILQAEIFNRKKLNILSIGCGIPVDFFELIYHSAIVDSLVGLDYLESEIKVIESESRKVNKGPYWKFRNDQHFAQCLMRYIKVVKDSTKEERILGMPKFLESWRAVWEFTPRYNICEKDLSEFRNFDLILFNQVLHFVERDKQEWVLTNVANCLADDGLLTITVNLKENRMFENPNDFKEIENNGFRSKHSKRAFYPFDVDQYRNLFAKESLPNFELIENSEEYSRDSKGNGKHIFGIWKRYS